MVSTPGNMTWSSLRRALRERLLPTEGDDASFCAKELLAAASGHTAEELLMLGPEQVPQETAEKAMENAERLVSGEPLAYILGEWDFRGLNLRVTSDTLIPREDTGAVTELALKALKETGPEARVLDLCTGTGCIGLALAAEYPQLRVTLADLSEKALAVAEENTARLFPDRKNIEISRLDALAVPPIGLAGSYDVLVSNPPYITAAEMEALPASVKDYEPELALFGGEDGLCFYRSLTEKWSSVLRPGGFLAMEFGMGQEQAVCELLRSRGLEVLDLKKDGGGIIRAVLARRTEKENNYK